MTTRSQSTQMTTSCNTCNTVCTRLVNTLNKKIEQLVIKENGCVSDGSRGSFVIGSVDGVDDNNVTKEFIVQFGWNYNDTVICIGINQLRAVVKTLIKNKYAFYHSEDMLIQFDGSENDFGRYRKFPLYHPEHDADLLMDLLGYTREEYLALERSF